MDTQSPRNVFNVEVTVSYRDGSPGFGNTKIMEKRSIEIRWNLHCPNGLSKAIRTSGGRQFLTSGRLTHRTDDGIYNIELFIAGENGGNSNNPGIYLRIIHPFEYRAEDTQNRVSFNPKRRLQYFANHHNIGNMVNMVNVPSPAFSLGPLITFIKEREQWMMTRVASTGLSPEYLHSQSFHDYVFDFSIALPIPTQNSTSEPLALNTNNLFGTKACSDLTVNAGRMKYPAHKLILSARSPIFKKMFSESTLENLKGELNLEKFDYRVVFGFLEFIYTGGVTDLHGKAEGLIELAEKYEVLGLKKTCEQTLIASISFGNVLNRYKLGKLVKSEALVQRSIEAIKKHKKSIWKTEDEFKESCKEFPELLYKVLV